VASRRTAGITGIDRPSLHPGRRYACIQPGGSAGRRPRSPGTAT